jgi:hypothetical protein
VAYYDHRPNWIDKTNIIQVVKAVEGETTIFETALDHESEDQLGTSGEIVLDRKISRYCPFKAIKGVFTTKCVYYTHYLPFE